jgi:hypothetical protein
MGLPRPPEPWRRALWRSAAKHLRPPGDGGGALGGARLCNLLAGAAALASPPPPELRGALLEAAAAAAEAGDPRACARVAHCVASLGWRPGRRWLVRYAAASRPLLGAFAPRDLANAAWALARMGGPPDRR